MSDPLIAATKAASNGLFAQSTRMRVISENLANAETTGKTAGSDPYQRKTINFESVTDEEQGVDLVQVGDISRDEAPFRTEYILLPTPKATSNCRTSIC
jgi:flagellar basal-body rod protein FlgC